MSTVTYPFFLNKFKLLKQTVWRVLKISMWEVFSSIYVLKIGYSDYPKSLTSKTNDVYVFFNVIEKKSIYFI